MELPIENTKGKKVISRKFQMLKNGKGEKLEKIFMKNFYY